MKYIDTKPKIKKVKPEVSARDYWPGPNSGEPIGLLLVITKP